MKATADNIEMAVSVGNAAKTIFNECLENHDLPVSRLPELYRRLSDKARGCVASIAEAIVAGDDRQLGAAVEELNLWMMYQQGALKLTLRAFAASRVPPSVTRQ